VPRTTKAPDQFNGLRCGGIVQLRYEVPFLQML